MGIKIENVQTEVALKSFVCDICGKEWTDNERGWYGEKRCICEYCTNAIERVCIDCRLDFIVRNKEKIAKGFEKIRTMQFAGSTGETEYCSELIKMADGFDYDKAETVTVATKKMFDVGEKVYGVYFSEATNKWEIHSDTIKRVEISSNYIVYYGIFGKSIIPMTEEEANKEVEKRNAKEATDVES